jgi:hypothetical protein
MRYLNDTLSSELESLIELFPKKGEKGMKKVVLLIMMNLILTGCATSDMRQDYTLGNIHRDMFVVEGKQVPLPEGEWKVVGAGLIAVGEYRQVILQKEIAGHKFAGLVKIVSNTLMNDAEGYFHGGAAERKDLYFVSATSISRNQALDYWLINYTIFSFPSDVSKALNQHLKYLTDNKIEAPKLLPYSNHVLTAKKSNGYLEVTYYYNPETEGFDMSKENYWGSSSWHVARIQADPKKVAYMENIKKQGEALHSKIREWFKY